MISFIVNGIFCVVIGFILGFIAGLHRVKKDLIAVRESYDQCKADAEVNIALAWEQRRKLEDELEEMQKRAIYWSRAAEENA